MTRSARRRTLDQGTSLIEVLVVIVVFLVGILAVIQVFPPGLNVLRTTRNNTVASQLASAEMQRILGQPGQVAEMIVPVQYVTTTGGLRVQIRANRLPNEMLPDRDQLGNGLIDSNGNVVINGQSQGDWMRNSGPNHFSRIIGESKPVPAPRRVPALAGNFGFGGLLQLTFGPAYYFADANTGIGEPGFIQVYGNDLRRQRGDRENGQPRENGRFDETTYFFVDHEDADPADVPAWQSDPCLDQIWVAPSFQRREFRVVFSFAYNNAGRVEQYDLIVPVVLDPLNVPPYAATVGNYWVISLSRLAAEPDVFGNPPQFDPLNYLSTDSNSVRMQRVYSEIPGAQAFSTTDPYEYKVLGSGSDPASGLGYSTGSLLISPTAFNYRVLSATGRVPLQARVDYTVYDWRIIRDEFRVPSNDPPTVKLALNSVKSLGTEMVDSRRYKGLGIAAPTLQGLAAGQTDDLLLVDIDSGAVVLGNLKNNNQSAWFADKQNGFVSFRDVDGDATNGLSAYLCYPTGDPVTPWTAPVLVPEVRNRNVRALYMGIGEWAAQPLKAARSYRLAFNFRANGLGPAECYIGGTLDPNGIPHGQPYRLYLPVADLNQKIVVGEVWVNDGSGPRQLADQEFEISGLETVDGVQMAYADVRSKVPGSVFDYSQGYAVRNVRGASIKVRALWNPSGFRLDTDQAANYRALEEWARQWRRTETQSFPVGGRE